MLLVQVLVRLTGNGGYSFLLFIFAEGVLGADLAFRPASRRWLMPGALLCTLATFLTWEHHKMLEQCFIGLGVALLLARLAQERRGIGNKLLGWKPLAWIGTFSYSLYLVHGFVEIGSARWLMWNTNLWTVATHAERALFLTLLLPITLLLSYAFHLVFELPFMGAPRQRAERHLEPRAVVDLPASILQINKQFVPSIRPHYPDPSSTGSAPTTTSDPPK